MKVKHVFSMAILCGLAATTIVRAEGFASKQNDTLADLNCDGINDRVSFNARSSDWIVAYGKRQGGFRNQEVFAIWSKEVIWMFPLVGDVSGDGCDDVIGLAHGGISDGAGWWVTEGGRRETRAWGVWQIRNEWGQVYWTDVQLRDSNRDRLLDVVGTATSRGGSQRWAAQSTGREFENVLLRNLP